MAAVEGPAAARRLFARVNDLLLRTVIACEDEVASLSLRRGVQPDQCFELLGFDVMIDDQLNPWLIEVNIGPSLSVSSPLDRRIKTALLRDVFNIVGVPVPGNGPAGDGSGRPAPPAHTARAQAQTAQAARDEAALRRLRAAEGGAGGRAMGSATGVRGAPKPGPGPAGSGPRLLGPRASSAGAGGASASAGDAASLELTPADLTLVRKVEFEYLRRGAFTRLFPHPATHAQYAPFLAPRRRSNRVLARFAALPLPRALDLLGPPAPDAGYAAAGLLGVGRTSLHPAPATPKLAQQVQLQAQALAAGAAPTTGTAVSGAAAGAGPRVGGGVRVGAPRSAGLRAAAGSRRSTGFTLGPASPPSALAAAAAAAAAAAGGGAAPALATSAPALPFGVASSSSLLRGLAALSLGAGPGASPGSMPMGPGPSPGAGASISAGAFTGTALASQTLGGAAAARGPGLRASVRQLQLRVHAEGLLADAEAAAAHAAAEAAAAARAAAAEEEPEVQRRLQQQQQHGGGFGPAVGVRGHAMQAVGVNQNAILFDPPVPVKSRAAFLQAGR
jgi:hypothetical protein